MWDQFNGSFFSFLYWIEGSFGSRIPELPSTPLGISRDPHSDNPARPYHIRSQQRRPTCKPRKLKELLLQRQNQSWSPSTGAQTETETEPAQDPSTGLRRRTEQIVVVALLSPPEEDANLSIRYHEYDCNTLDLPIGAAGWNQNASRVLVRNPIPVLLAA